MRTTIPILRKLLDRPHSIATAETHFRTFFDYIYDYSMASTADAVYVIGGGPRWVQTIGEFRNYRWKNKAGFYLNVEYLSLTADITPSIVEN